MLYSCRIFIDKSFNLHALIISVSCEPIVFLQHHALQPPYTVLYISPPQPYNLPCTMPHTVFTAAQLLTHMQVCRHSLVTP